MSHLHIMDKGKDNGWIFLGGGRGIVIFIADDGGFRGVISCNG